LENYSAWSLLTPERRRKFQKRMRKKKRKQKNMLLDPPNVP
jgi:CRISPR/Cas system-associated endonuclease Cas1